MCDGHSQFMSEDIEYRVYCLLMTPDSAGAKYPTTPRRLRDTGYLSVLSERTSRGVLTRSARQTSNRFAAQ